MFSPSQRMSLLRHHEALAIPTHGHRTFHEHFTKKTLALIHNEDAQTPKSIVRRRRRRRRRRRLVVHRKSTFILYVIYV
jgi:hypothetical protein